MPTTTEPKNFYPEMPLRLDGETDFEYRARICTSNLDCQCPCHDTPTSPLESLEASDTRIDQLLEEANTIVKDLLKTPSHYTQGSLECIDATKAMMTPDEWSGYCRGQAVAYIWRAPHKGCYDEDLKKAVNWLRMAVGDDFRENKTDDK